MTINELLAKCFLVIHILAGMMSFVLAPIALATAKGGKQHKRWGMIYLWSMGIVAATALPLSFFFPVRFLALVAVFSFYFAFSGYRVLRLKGLAQGGSAAPIDWIAGIITLVSSAWLVWLSWRNPTAIEVISLVGVVFGLIGVFGAARQLVSFIWKPQQKMFWWFTHFGNFIGSYIAAWSAFSVVTLGRIFGNHWWLWLWPTLIGVPAISIMTAYYQRKFAPRKTVLASD